MFKVSRPNLCLIAAIDSHYGFARCNKIPWNFAEDYNFFQDVTSRQNNQSIRNAVIFGKNTWCALPEMCRSLPNRINLVISSDMTNDDIKIKNTTNTETHIFNNIQKALNHCLEKKIDNVFFCGGKSIYEEALKYHSVDRIYLTQINNDYNCDLHLAKDLVDGVTSKYFLQSQKKMSLLDKTLNNTFDVTFSKFYRQPTQIVNPEEIQYLDVIDSILKTGHRRQTRNAVTYSKFGETLKFDLKNGFPLLTTKKVFFRGIVEELLYFLKGDTNSLHLSEKGVKIWEPNTTREFLDSMGFYDYKIGEMGPCFPKGTLVLTTNGMKHIEDITINNNIISHLGNIKHVQNIMKRKYSGQLMSIYPTYMPYPIQCTPEHPFYARKYQIDGKNTIIAENPSFVQAKDLTTDNYLVGMKIDKNEIIPEFQMETDIIKLDDPDFWWTMGLFVSNGQYVISNKTKEKLHSVFPTIDAYGCQTYKNTKLEVSTILKQFYNDVHEKIIPQFVHRAPRNLIRAFIDGYTASNDIGNIKTVSDDIAFSIQRLYAKLGYLGEIKSCNLHNTYKFKIYQNSNNHSIIENDYVWFTIKDISKQNVTNIPVYNLTVEDDNTYIVNNISVHNCYGFQWRHFNADYSSTKVDYTNAGFDQIKYCMETLKKDPYSRRIMMTTYNPLQAHKGVLFPCHGIVTIFNVEDGHRLSCMMTQRSADYICGVPFNIASYALLIHMMCEVLNNDETYTGLKFSPGRLIMNLGDTHIYDEHLTAARRQLLRDPYVFPQLSFKRKLTSLTDVSFDDIVLSNYTSYPVLSVKMIA